MAQDCPPNIDFEKGDFSNWVCYVGNVVGAGGLNIISLSPVSGPVPDQHTMYSRADAGQVDYYGGFPVLCPNGSGYSVKLGNTTGGAQAEGLSYEFTIPPGRNTYSLIYNYAVVFQDPNHLEFQQPRLELEVTNVTDNELITCSSFTFFPNGSPLPGFFQSTNGGDTTPVWCKNWTAVSISLNGQAGKTIRLMFKTADCTFRRHFGYAYIDVNSECSSEFTGATYCPDDTAVVLTAPYGYQAYTWHDINFTTVLGSGQVLNLAPPPPPGTVVAVELIPYEGYGCKDTLYANLIDTLKLKAKAGADAVFCSNNPLFIGDYPQSGVVYNWTPPTGLSNPTLSNPQASPTVITEYILNINSLGGGCRNADTVIVTPILLDTTLRLLGKNNFCITTGDSAVLLVNPADSIQWYRNNAPISGAHGVRLKALQSGVYKAQLFDKRGCNEFTRNEEITIELPRPGIRYPLEYSVINLATQLQARNFGTQYTWQPATNLNNSNIANPIFNSSIESEITYKIEIITASGCVTIDTQTVKTVKEVKIYVPTGFTPNSDGKNDYLRPILIGIRQLNYFRVYNRWGQLVYDMPSGARGWDGLLNGIMQNPDVYVWMVEGLGADRKIHFQKGTVMLIR